MSDLLFRPASELAGLVRAGELSARELVRGLARAHRGARPRAQRVRRRLRRRRAAPRPTRSAPGDERPFAGVPIAIKNNRAIAGKRLTFAADFFGDWEAPYDHNVVRRLKEAGFVVVGSTTLPEWGILPWTNTKRFGPTRNPWDPARTSGGSSGGSATAVAAGMVPDRPRQRRRRLDAHPGRVLRPRRPQAPAQPHLAGARDRARASSPSTACSRARSRDTALALDLLAGTEARRRVVGAAAGRALRRHRGARAGRPARGRGHQRADRRAARPGARRGRARGRSPARVARPPRRGGARRRGASDSLLQAFTALFAPLVTLQIAFGRLVHGREPEPSTRWSR